MTPTGMWQRSRMPPEVFYTNVWDFPSTPTFPSECSTRLVQATSSSLFISQAVLVGVVLYSYYCNYAVSMFVWCYAGGDLDDLAFFPSFRRDDPKFSVGWRHEYLVRSVTEPCPFCSISARTHSKFIPYLTRISYVMNSPLFRELKAFFAEGL